MLDTIELRLITEDTSTLEIFTDIDRVTISVNSGNKVEFVGDEIKDFVETMKFLIKVLD